MAEKLRPKEPAAPMTEDCNHDEALEYAHFHRDSNLARCYLLLRTEAARARKEAQAAAIDAAAQAFMGGLADVPNNTANGQIVREFFIPVIQQLQRTANELRNSQPPDAGAEGPE